MALIRVDRLLEFSPFKNPVWDIRSPITRREVTAVLKRGDLWPVPLEGKDLGRRQAHVKRVGYLVRHGWHDPIAVDVGVPVLGYYREWLPTDGHHRLAAAIYRGDEFIAVEVSGQLDYASEVLGVPEASLRLVDAEAS